MKDKKLPEFDPALVEIVERKLDPYRGRLSPEMLDHFRAEALVLLSTHPYPAALLKQLQPAPVVQHSTTVPTGGESNVPNNGVAERSFGRSRERPKRGGGR